MKKKISVLILSLALISTLMPTVAIAEDEVVESKTAITVDDGVNGTTETVIPAKGATETKSEVAEGIESEEVVEIIGESAGDKKDPTSGLISGILDKLSKTKIAVFISTIGQGAILDSQVAIQDSKGDYYIKKPDNSVAERDGYKFLGWTKSFGSKDYIAWDKTVEGKDGAWDNYSQFVYASYAENEYNLVLHNGDQEVVVPVKYSDKFKIHVPISFYGKGDKLIFDGWATAADNTANVQDNEIINVSTLIKRSYAATPESITADGDTFTIDLYATWTDVCKHEINYHESLPLVSDLIEQFPQLEGISDLVVEANNMPDNAKIAAGGCYTVPSTEPTLTIGGTVDIPAFITWNTQADGKGINIKPGTTLKFVDRDIELYAVWHLESFDINYHLNGGDEASIPDDAKYYFSGVAEMIVLPTPTRHGYDFVGWHEKEDLSDPVVESFNADRTGDIDLYAEWKAAEYTITFVDGFGGVVKHVQKYGEETITPPDPTRANMVFQGWDPEVSQLVDGDATYTAQWKFSDITGFNLGVNTGDHNELSLYITLALVAIAGMIAAIAYKKRTN